MRLAKEKSDEKKSDEKFPASHRDKFVWQEGDITITPPPKPMKPTTKAEDSEKN